MSKRANLEGSVTTPEGLLAHLSSGAHPAVPERCIISHLPAFDAELGAREHRDIRIGGLGRLRLCDVGVGLIRGAQGAPAAAAQLEMLLAVGFRAVVVVGPAGHPCTQGPQLELGDVVLAEGALIYEGTSSHYGMVNRVAAASGDAEARLREAGLPHRRGLVATTDALFRETRSWLAEVENRGALLVDMELSALLSVAAFHGAQLEAMLVVSDLVGERWELGFNDTRVAASARRLASLWM